MTPLSASENSLALQAKIEGLELGQVPAVNRLRALAVPSEMIYSAITAKANLVSEAEQTADYERAEEAIITWAMQRFNVTFGDALDILNGKASPVQQA